MAYVKQTWSCGDEISAEKLNHMEEGIESASIGGGTSGIVVTEATTAFDSDNYPVSTAIEMPVSEMLQYLADGKVVIALEHAHDPSINLGVFHYYFIVRYAEHENPALIAIHIGAPWDGGSNYVQQEYFEVENDTATTYYDIG